MYWECDYQAGCQESIYFSFKLISVTDFKQEVI